MVDTLQGTVQAVIETYTSVTMYHTYNVLAFSEEGDKDTLIVVRWGSRSLALAGCNRTHCVVQ